ncbi:MAG: carboxylesterase/lipase family protein, partial [Planctomycetota bacterium]
MRSRRRWVAGLWIVAALGILASMAPADELHVQTQSGPIAGDYTDVLGEVRAFLGIPFAAPPIDELRWQPPQPHAPWSEVRDATEFGASCHQPDTLLGQTEGEFSEDCLYLNVWTPAAAVAESLPVMVWIHGGGFASGSGSQSATNGTALAREGVVVVGINYRLGPFGFLAHPALSAESDDGISGNYGLLDQIAALQWVQDNISAFGGDPDNVTIFGVSAGGISVCSLLTSPLAEGLFHRGIIESGAAAGMMAPLRSDDPGARPMEAVGEIVAERLGIDTEGAEAVAALRAVDAEALLAAADPSIGLFGGGLKFWPCVDGVVLPAEPAAAIAAGDVPDVPVLLGTTTDEATIFVSRLVRPMQPMPYRLLLRTVFGRRTDDVVAAFPIVAPEDAPLQIGRIVTHACFTAPTRRVARALAEHNRSDVYLYQFSRVCQLAETQGLGAFHGAEVPYVFGTKRIILGFTDLDIALSRTIRCAWVRFAETGDPNGVGLPDWPAYEAESAY